MCLAGWMDGLFRGLCSWLHGDLSRIGDIARGRTAVGAYPPVYRLLFVLQTRGTLKTQEAPKAPQKAPGGLRRCQKAQEAPRLTATSSLTWPSQGLPEASWALGPPGPCWGLLGPGGAFWRPLGSSWGLSGASLRPHWGEHDQIVARLLCG